MISYKLALKPEVVEMDAISLWFCRFTLIYFQIFSYMIESGDASRKFKLLQEVAVMTPPTVLPPVETEHCGHRICPGSPAAPNIPPPRVCAPAPPPPCSPPPPPPCSLPPPPPRSCSSPVPSLPPLPPSDLFPPPSIIKDPSSPPEINIPRIPSSPFPFPFPFSPPAPS
ncbi:hypothetical protein MANES_08G137761v8 [Manihot esculenta]|uniref:Uncharacterized protein n=1 Tax=Manihot esculenta TaxID=3983 RepID=A0ACB7HBE7_MANES|nr:hypothetical protein MANES_08G137761v8 [Manihot esculenta]